MVIKSRAGVVKGKLTVKKKMQYDLVFSIKYCIKMGTNLLIIS